ncbi:Glycine--tRNA ligase 1, mitochondrial [Apophysomyces sp. BC1034]|nr:Glycine--tRNA ligase 1, mitochondrial [Apophysomyces sp. BC1015]KAG0183595.1 Glycine--tRNA ligase 1, mitochondrial [Apophysomyces sp. BC1021]KAG0183625.1 Glycine--tRNA ligase 1, mitochondrial [Apophysomyces sp. BC1021]KAG0194883.1 Glycine--tRNA ligase 1, mitochondrial [Apophysomyces sp. BC1034]
MATEKPFDRSALEQLVTKRFFYAPSFQIYGGVAGLYDYGPSGSALMNNIISVWRNHFVLEEEMLELDTSIMTTYDVLKTSGHVDKFADWMCKDLKNGEIFRADHVIEAVLEARLQGDREARAAKEGKAVDPKQVDADKAKDAKKKKKKGVVVAVELSEGVRKTYEETLAQIDNYSGEELAEIMKKFDIRSPESGNELSTPQEFNLMFESSIGPTGQLKGFLRPETAQGQFVNFKKLLEFNNEKMPFASAQVGRSFRNEISPRSGLLRVREFTMAEIEHFVDPENKQHPSFEDVTDVKISVLPKGTQLQGRTDTYEITIGEAKIIDNQTLGYFIARIYLFLMKIGIKPELLRFRQHMDNEMAHYACDCWDAEIKTSYGWIECVGCADRSAYDLTVHSRRTKEKLVVREQLAEPRVVEQWQVEINKKTFGPKYKKSAKAVEEALMAYTDECYAKLQQDLETAGVAQVEADGQQFEVSKVDVTVKRATVTEHVREYTPNVIEPSFGIGRILYALLEHSWWVRDGDEARNVLSFPVAVAPFKCCLLPLSGNAAFEPFVKKFSRELRKSGVSTRTDDSKTSIGRRYARNDELGIPYAITIDFQTVEDNTVTLRKRDSTEQIRDTFENILKILKEDN